MRNRVTYEWDIETLEPHDPAKTTDPDILDHHHADKLSDLPMLEEYQRLVLVRDVGNETEGLVDRTWAYVEYGMLPSHFSYTTDENGYMDGAGKPVPQRFHRELAAHMAAVGLG